MAHRSFLIGGIVALIVVLLTISVDYLAFLVIRDDRNVHQCQTTLEKLFDQLDEFYLRDEKLPLDRDGRLATNWLESARSPELGKLNPCSHPDWDRCYVRPIVRLNRFPTDRSIEEPALLLCDRPGNHSRRSPLLRRAARTETVVMLFSDGSVRMAELDVGKFSLWVEQVDAGSGEPYPPGFGM